MPRKAFIFGSESPNVSESELAAKVRESISGDIAVGLSGTTSGPSPKHGAQSPIGMMHQVYRVLNNLQPEVKDYIRGAGLVCNYQPTETYTFYCITDEEAHLSDEAALYGDLYTNTFNVKSTQDSDIAVAPERSDRPSRSFWGRARATLPKAGGRTREVA